MDSRLKKWLYNIESLASVLSVDDPVLRTLSDQVNEYNNLLPLIKKLSSKSVKVIMNKAHVHYMYKTFTIHVQRTCILYIHMDIHVYVHYYTCLFPPPLSPLTLLSSPSTLIGTHCLLLLRYSTILQFNTRCTTSLYTKSYHPIAPTYLTKSASRLNVRLHSRTLLRRSRRSGRRGSSF